MAIITLPIDLVPAVLAATIKAEQDNTKKVYVVVNASRINGEMWCGDCRDAESLLEEKFADSEDELKVVYAGTREEWRAPGNPWKEAPFSITKLPTLVKIQDGKWERLVEGDVYDQAKLDAFVD